MKKFIKLLVIFNMISFAALFGFYQMYGPTKAIPNYERLFFWATYIFFLFLIIIGSMFLIKGSDYRAHLPKMSSKTYFFRHPMRGRGLVFNFIRAYTWLTAYMSTVIFSAIIVFWVFGQVEIEAAFRRLYDGWLFFILAIAFIALLMMLLKNDEY